ncbi:membrane-spanning 4-domains subfamily A member 15-like [Colossoma macropomum]|uniref:membrane-spanning 4-domains subfamily A member 15-like n=1 Tax=Colossoma macropomum TaxID=42526 RepID=UPI001865192A|nr:membrane-spanning 4-domains subfamily A member 15-like [Colossoma macropomum]
MATSVAPVENTRNGFTIVTHVIPPQTAPAGTGQHEPGTGAGGCTIGEPKVLGTVQIMIGLLTLMFGIVSEASFKTLSGYIGITFWGSLSYISSGALSVASTNHASSCVGATRGISGVLLVFSVLELFICICTSGFTCKATCCTDLMTVFLVNNPGYVQLVEENA